MNRPLAVLIVRHFHYTAFLGAIHFFLLKNLETGVCFYYSVENTELLGNSCLISGLGELFLGEEWNFSALAQENSTCFFVQYKQKERPSDALGEYGCGGSGSPPEVLAVGGRCQPDIFLKGTAEMAVVIEPKLVADAADRQFTVHQQALGFADAPVKQIFHRRKPCFCFENV